jgi:hypothetical protein
MGSPDRRERVFRFEIVWRMLDEIPLQSPRVYGAKSVIANNERTGSRGTPRDPIENLTELFGDDSSRVAKWHATEPAQIGNTIASLLG